MSRESGVGCTNIGHSNQQILKRINTQIEELIHHGYSFRNKSSEELSLKLQQLAGFEGGASVFLSSGSEAVNLSITLARRFTGRKKILKIDNSYLSAFGFGQISDENEALVNVKFNDLDSIDKIDFKEIAAFLVETGGASVDMVRIPNDDFIHKLGERCRENECLIIAEEVTTGMGRMGKWFGYQHYMTGDFFKKQLEQVQSKYPKKVKELCARELMLALEFGQDVNGEWISQQLFESGFVKGFKQNTLRFLPPLTIKNSDTDKLIFKLYKLLKMI